MGAGPSFDPTSSTHTFTVACPDYVELVLLAPLLRRFTEEAPQINLRVVPLVRVLDDDLERGDVDLLFSPKRRAAAGVVWTPLLDETHVAVVDRAHPIRRLTIQTLARLPHVFVAPSGEANGQLDELLARRRMSRRIAVQVADFLVVPHLLNGDARREGLARGLAGTNQRQVEHGERNGVGHASSLPRTNTRPSVTSP